MIIYLIIVILWRMEKNLFSLDLCTILEWIYRYARQARILDGADEIHKMVLANTYRAEGRDFWSWGK